MKLSIIIPVYNAGKFLTNCLDSILKPIKNNKEIEIIVINDGSTDNFKEVIKNHQTKVTVYNNKNHGVSYTRNFGIDKAKGIWVMFVDADDKLSRTWYKEIENYLESDKDIIYTNESDNTNNIIELLERTVGIKKSKGNYTSVCGKLYRTSFLKQKKIKFQEKIIHGEDMLFNIETMLNTNKYDFINSSIYNYRYNEMSATNTFNEKIFLSDKLFRAELINLLKKNNVAKQNSSNLIKHITNNAIITIAIKISYLKDYKQKKQYYQKLYNDYHKLIDTNNESKQRIIILQLLKLKLYKIIDLILIIKRNKKQPLEFTKM